MEYYNLWPAATESVGRPQHHPIRGSSSIPKQSRGEIRLLEGISEELQKKSFWVSNWQKAEAQLADQTFYTWVMYSNWPTLRQR